MPVQKSNIKVAHEHWLPHPFQYSTDGVVDTMWKSKSNVVFAQAKKACSGSTDILPLINLCTRWGWVANFTPRPLYSWQRTQSPAGRFWRTENSLPLPSFEHRTFQAAASHYTNYAVPAVANGIQRKSQFWKQYIFYHTTDWNTNTSQRWQDSKPWLHIFSRPYKLPGQNNG